MVSILRQARANLGGEMQIPLCTETMEIGFMLRDLDVSMRPYEIFSHSPAKLA